MFDYLMLNKNRREGKDKGRRESNKGKCQLRLFIIEKGEIKRKGEKEEESSEGE